MPPVHRSLSRPNMIVPVWWESYKLCCADRLNLRSTDAYDTLQYIRGQTAARPHSTLTPRRRDKAVRIYHEFVETHEPYGPHN